MIRFLHNQTEVALTSERADMTLLDWLRLTAHKTGTKEGCGSGDCGACTVVVASLSDTTDGLPLCYESINSCITFAGSLHGRQLITVEDLADGENLHPVQQAMVDEHGSQCGFCTPGFVMSLFALYHSGDADASGAGGVMRVAGATDAAETFQPASDSAPSDHTIDQFLGGNLCRCTGYRPIRQAAKKALADRPADQFDQQAGEIARALLAIKAKPAQHATFLIPESLAELAQYYLAHPDARLLGGGTDLALEVTQQLKALDTLLYIKQVPELQQVERDSNSVTLGAGVSLTRCLAELRSLIPDSEQLLLRFGSEQVRNQGTIGGNIGSASPIGDLPPMLMALDACLILQCGDVVRELPIERYFHSYKVTDLAQGEFIRAIRIPFCRADARFSIYKVSKRMDDDISAVCGVFHLQMSDGVVNTARIVFGGMAAVPKRADVTEQALMGQTFSAVTIANAQQAMLNDFQPLSDARASAAYRMQVAQNLLQRFWLETQQPAVETRVVDYVCR